MKPTSDKNKMDYKEWIAFLGSLEKRGFKITRHSHMHKNYAEFYKWNQWTVQIHSVSGYDFVHMIGVELFFDSEALDYRNRSWTYPVRDAGLAREMAMGLIAKMGGDILSEVFATA